MTDSGTPYTVEYFQAYVRRSRFRKKDQGDRRVYRYWIDYLRKHLPGGGRLVEIGCGLGYFGRLAQPHFDYVGTDISEAALSWAREHHGIRETQYADAEKTLPFDDGSCDGIVAFDVVEHLSDPATFFREARRILKPGGLLLLSTPNTSSLGVQLKRGSGNLVASMYRDSTHVSLLPPDEWLSIATEAGLEITRRGTDQLWDAPYVEWCPARLQHVILFPLNYFVERFAGSLAWSIGENLILVARRPV